MDYRKATGAEISAAELRAIDFRRRLRGYDCDEVDDFLTRVERTLLGKPDRYGPVTTEAIRQVMFHERFRGYDADAVDDVLERAGAAIALLG